jgi:hypothetical protein
MGAKVGGRVTAELVDEAVNAWYGALKAFALLQPEGLFQEGERGTKLLVTGVRMAFPNGVFSSARRPDAGAITALLPSRETFGLPWSIQVRIRTRTGRAMMAIRDNPLAARSMGINNPMYKAVTFGVSGLYTGIAGALGAIVVQFVLRIVSPFICRWLFWSAWS